MIYSIQSSELIVQVNSVGMELCSIHSKKNNQEYLWQGNPEIWNGQAPVLFPVVGALKDGQMSFDGIKFSLPRHGFVRNSTKPKLIDSGENFLRFGLTWDEELLKVYPFKFKLEIKFLLEEKTLHIQHFISNEGEDSMLYSIGAHPAFNCPLFSSEKYEDYYLEFSEKETDFTYLIDPSGLISQERKLVLDQTKELPLHSHLFDKDALVFKKLKSRKVSLVNRNRGAIVAVEFKDFKYLGIWAKPNAPFVCIEPWLGIADSVDTDQNFEEKEGILKLLPSQNTTKTYSISILE